MWENSVAVTNAVPAGRDHRPKIRGGKSRLVSNTDTHSFFSREFSPLPVHASRPRQLTIYILTRNEKMERIELEIRLEQKLECANEDPLENWKGSSAEYTLKHNLLSYARSANIFRKGNKRQAHFHHAPSLPFTDKKGAEYIHHGDASSSHIPQRRLCTRTSHKDSKQACTQTLEK